MKNKILAVLGYHKIGKPAKGGWETWYYTGEEIFKTHLRAIQETGWPVLSAGQFLKGLDDPSLFPQRSVLITFDDAYASISSYAQPILDEFGYPAVVFLPSGLAGGMNTFDAGLQPDEAICGWSGLRELEKKGTSVQSHGVTHGRFSGLNEKALLYEISASKLDIEKNVNNTVSLLAYPYGDNGADPDLTDSFLKMAGYRAAFLYDDGINYLPPANPFRLSRIPMGPDTDITGVFSKLK